MAADDYERAVSIDFGATKLLANTVGKIPNAKSVNKEDGSFSLDNDTATGQALRSSPKEGAGSSTWPA